MTTSSPLGMKKLKSIKASVEMQSRFKVPRRIFDIASSAKAKAAKPGKPKDTATAFLQKIAKDLEIPPDLSNLKFDEARSSLLGTHVLFQQQFEGMPVTGAWIRVDIAKDGNVFQVVNDLIPESALKKAPSGKKARKSLTAVAPPTQPTVSEADAEAAARAALGQVGTVTVVSKE